MSGEGAIWARDRELGCRHWLRTCVLSPTDPGSNSGSAVVGGDGGGEIKLLPQGNQISEVAGSHGDRH